MEYVIADADRVPLGYLDEIESLDVDAGDTNDFQVILDREQVKRYGVGHGSFLFVPGTEFGGIIEDVNSQTSESSITYMGYIWRGLLDQLIIEPPAGSGYLTVSGDAHDVFRKVLTKGTGLMFEVPEEPSGIVVKATKFRYVSALKGFANMLASAGARLDIKAVEGVENEPFKIVLSAVTIKNYDEELEYNGDDDVNVETRDYRRGINHLICLGTGEMADRTVIHLYAQLDGSISRKQYYKGTQERTAVYEYTSAESEEELIKGATDCLQELMNYKSADMTVTDIDLDIGDIVSARDRDAGILLSRPVVGKILRYSDGEESIEYKLKGEC